MTYELIRSALETRLNALSPSVPIAWENAAFSPATSLFQRVNFLPARTENPTFGDDMHRESGIFQVSVYGAVGKGYAESLMRAELIRSWFPRGLSLVNGEIGRASCRERVSSPV